MEEKWYVFILLRPHEGARKKKAISPRHLCPQRLIRLRERSLECKASFLLIEVRPSDVILNLDFPRHLRKQNRKSQTIWISSCLGITRSRSFWCKAGKNIQNVIKLFDNTILWNEIKHSFLPLVVGTIELSNPYCHISKIPETRYNSFLLTFENSLTLKFSKGDSLGP